MVICDLSNLFGGVRDQGMRPTCLAFAVSDTHASLRGGWEMLSCEYLYYHALKYDNATPLNGTTVSSVLKALEIEGQPLEIDWKYLDILPSDLSLWVPPGNVSVHKRSGETIAAKIDELINLLKKSCPVVIVIDICDSFYTPDADGVVRLQIGEQPDPNRRHAVIAIAYGEIENENAFLVRNSWGDSWGNAGCTWLKESYLKLALTEIVQIKGSI